MSEALLIALSAIYWLAAMVNLIICVRRPDLWEVWDFVFGPVYTISAFLLLISAVLARNWTGVVIFSVCVALGAWSWWNNDRHRRNRKKLLARGARRVVDLGARFGVISSYPHH